MTRNPEQASGAEWKTPQRAEIGPPCARDCGVFYDLDVVAAPTAELHSLSQAALGFDARQQDPPTNRRAWRIS